MKTVVVGNQGNQVHNACVRARQRGLSAELTVDDWKLTLEDFEERCAYCGGTSSTIDHFISLARGTGSDVGFSRVRFSQ